MVSVTAEGAVALLGAEEVSISVGVVDTDAEVVPLFTSPVADILDVALPLGKSGNVGDITSGVIEILRLLLGQVLVIVISVLVEAEPFSDGRLEMLGRVGFVGKLVLAQGVNNGADDEEMPPVSKLTVDPEDVPFPGP